MPERYDKDLMKRGEAARRLISQGEDPYAMLLAAVWPGEDWSEGVLLARFTVCPRCSDATACCTECGSTGLVTAARRKLLTIEAIAAYAYEAA